MVGLAERSAEFAGDLIALTRGDSPVLRDEALRALVNTKLSDGQKADIKGLSGELAARVLGRPYFNDRPKPDDLDGWLKRLDGPADVAAGRRVFAQTKLGGCSRCHRVDGRGQDVGPDLSLIGRADRRNLVESLLQPGNTVAPHYQAWALTTTAGKTVTGMLVRTNLDESTYIDAQGQPFTLKATDVDAAEPARGSIMPTGLADLFTDQELRDLLAYLASRR